MFLNTIGYASGKLQPKPNRKKTYGRISIFCAKLSIYKNKTETQKGDNKPINKKNNNILPESEYP
jgi:hypothetical protein